jgi:hypothetical protein
MLNKLDSRHIFRTSLVGRLPAGFDVASFKKNTIFPGKVD